MSVLLRKTSLANLASFIVILAGTGYGIYVANLELVLLVTGAALGFLFKGVVTDGNKTNSN
jgi:hypothetical protein